jgi:transcriptional regulator with XRE-family HTH domain
MATDMKTPLRADQWRLLFRDAIHREFAELVNGVKSGQGSLADVAAQLGVSRQALDQYANGSVPASDVLLMAFLKRDMVIRIEDRGGDPSWCEFSVSDIDGGIKGRKRKPIQLSLFDALTDLDQNMDTLKKNVGRVEFEIERAFGKTG